MHLIPDDELERLAAEHGSASYHAIMLAELRERRARDEQVYCFQLGEFLVVCPMPTPGEEAQLELAYQATKPRPKKPRRERGGLSICLTPD